MKSTITHLPTHQFHYALTCLLVALVLLFTSCIISSETIGNSKQSQQLTKSLSIPTPALVPTPINIYIEYIGVENAFTGNWYGGNK